MRTVARAAAVWLVVVAGGTCLADEAWRKRLEGEAKKVEEAVAKLDAKTAAPGDLLARVNALHARLVVLETAASVAPGVVAGKPELLSLTQDLVTLNARVRQLTEPAGPTPPKPKPTKPAPKPEPSAPSPAPKAEPQWPDTLEFTATAKMTQRETGRYVLRYDLLGNWWNEFRMDGHEATVSFTLRAASLVREIRSAELRVALRMTGPFASEGRWRTYTVRWDARTSLWNGALQSWLKHDTFSVSVTPRWSTRPKDVTSSVDAIAHVRSVVTKDGATVAFRVPDPE
jgi:hypothetical protein